MNEFAQDLHQDPDPAETAEWLESIDSVAEAAGREHAGGLLERLLWHAQSRHMPLRDLAITPYQNTISCQQQPPYPGDEELEDRIENIVRWNAMAMVVRGICISDKMPSCIRAPPAAVKMT